MNDKDFFFFCVYPLYNTGLRLTGSFAHLVSGLLGQLYFWTQSSSLHSQALQMPNSWLLPWVKIVCICLGLSASSTTYIYVSSMEVK